jgi:hypothetical protein
MSIFTANYIKMIRVFLLSLFLSLSFYSFSQKVRVTVSLQNHIANPQSDTIYYNSDKSLTWNDFQGHVPANAPWGAMTASGFSFTSSMNDDGENIDVDINVFVFFIKHDSWKKPEINSAYHLEHEQHHFDITRLYAQKFVDELKKAHFTRSNYKELLNSLFDKVYDESMDLQHQYDLETRNSMNVEKQKEWNIKITADLKKLSAQ